MTNFVFRVFNQKYKSFSSTKVYISILFRVSVPNIELERLILLVLSIIYALLLFLTIKIKPSFSILKFTRSCVGQTLTLLLLSSDQVTLTMLFHGGIFCSIYSHSLGNLRLLCWNYK